MNVQVQRLNHVTAGFANKLDRSRGKVHDSRNAKAEQIMLYPIGWTELVPSETRSFPKSPK